MTNSELILRLVEMLLQEKEETMKAKEQQDKTRQKTNVEIHSIRANRVVFTGLPCFFEQKNSMCIVYGYTYSKQITSSKSKNNLFIVTI